MAFARTWDATYEAAPADSNLLSEGAARIREIRVDVRERLVIDHSWAGDADDGKHKKMTFVDPLGAKPTAVTDEGYLYTKNVDSKAELFWEDEDGNELQITTAGALRAAPELLSGEIKIWPADTEPSGWVYCDGQVYNSTSDTTFAALYAVIGNTYGGADGTDFQVPDLRGRVPIGTDDMGGSAASRITSGAAHGVNGATLGASGGVQEHAVTENEMPAHTHQITESWKTTGSNLAVTDPGGQNNNITRTTTSTGGSAAHTNLQPSLMINYIIKK